MSIPSRMLILNDCNLYKHSLNIRFQCLSIRSFFMKLKGKPSNRFFKVYQFYFLKFIETISNSYWNFWWSVWFISLKIQIQWYFLHSHFLKKLNVDIVWLSSIWSMIKFYIIKSLLPECWNSVISYLFHSITWFSRRQSPNC